MLVPFDVEHWSMILFELWMTSHFELFVGGGIALLCQMMWILLTKLRSGCKSKSWHL